MKRNLIVAAAALLSLSMSAQTTETRSIENGGKGDYKAVVVKDASLPEFTIYRPSDLKAAVQKEGRLPVLLFGNGGCSRSSEGYQNMLSEIASHGYIAIAIGPMPAQRHNIPTPPPTPTTNQAPAPAPDMSAIDFANIGKDDDMLEALDWLGRQSVDPASEYYHSVDLFKVAVSGHSCGGAQAMKISFDPRVSTTIMMNSGMGTMNMAGATPKSLDDLHAPILYLIGGPDDVAFPNSAIDFKNMKQGIPTVMANYPAGHGGTYSQPAGGLFGEITLMWLDWQLKGNNAQAAFFLDDKYRDDAHKGWTLERKNF